MQWDVIFQSAQTIATIVATGAAIWAAYDARRSRKTAEFAVRPIPIATATLVEASPYAESAATVFVEIRNRADVALTVLDATLQVQGYEFNGGGQKMKCALHVERLQENSDKNEKALVFSLSKTDVRRLTGRPSIILRMQWRDQSVETFAIKTMIVQLNEMTDSQ